MNTPVGQQLLTIEQIINWIKFNGHTDTSEKEEAIDDLEKSLNKAKKVWEKLDNSEG